MENILVTDNIVKEYGKARVLDHVSIQIPSGSICGLVGRNGAGKTTLMRIITGLQEPTAGSYSIFGVNNKDKKILKVRRRMGALVDSAGLFRNLSAYDNLKLQYINLGLPSFDGIPELLKLVGLEDAGKKKAGKFSLGMRQRLGIAIALCGEPDILVLDEPVNGLDPQGIIEMRELLIRINREKRTTIMISSHILDELNRLATHFAFIDKGRIIEEISSEELHSRIRRCTRFDTEDIREMCLLLDNEGLEYELSNTSMSVKVFDLKNISDLTLKAAQKGIAISWIQSFDETLESYFINLIGAEGKKKKDDQMS